VSESLSEPRIEMRHVRAAGLCSRGARTWCGVHGIDWTGFLTSGIPARVLTDTGDPFAARVVAVARREAASG